MRASTLAAVSVAVAVFVMGAAAQELQPAPDGNAPRVTYIGNYFGQTPPGATPEVFARGIVSTDNLEHSAPAFSPDGTEVFWSMWRRPDQGEPQVIMTARCDGGSWSVPAVASFSGRRVDAGPVFSADGKRLYFSSADPAPPPPGGTRVYDIAFVEKQGEGWSEPKCLNLVARYPELRFVYSPTIARDGTLYFTAFAPGPLNDFGLYRAEFRNGEYGKPELLPRNINLPPYLNWTPFIAPDESYLLFSSNRGSQPGDVGDLYLSPRQADGSWGDPASLGAPVNTEWQERFPALSPDGKYLFFTRSTEHHSHDIFWVDASTVPALRAVTDRSQENPK